MLLFVAVELAIWRPGVAFGVSAGVMGSSPSSDYQVGTWSLEWWPWAIQHGLNPLHTSLVWAPSGYPTTWMTSVPALGLLAAPITVLAGPLVSFNLLMLAASPAAAIACYLLCRQLCGRFWPALLGGFLFGFSPYLLAQTVAQHLNLVMVWPLPLLGLVAVRFCRGQMSSKRATVSSAALLLFLLGSSLEVFATSVLMGAILLALALVFERELRGRLAALARCLAGALLVCLALAAPIVWLMLTLSRPPLPYAPEQYATDLANILVPTPITFGGSTSFARGMSDHFVGNLGERDGYLGVPLVVVCLLAAWRDWRREASIAAGGLAIALLWSFGPSLVVAGSTLADLPFALDRFPLLALVLPSRLAVFVILTAACLAVRWLARPGLDAVRISLGILIALSFAPHLGSLMGAQAEAKAERAGLPSFAWAIPHAPFAFLRVANSLAPQTTVLALPTTSPVGFWQAESLMHFRIIGGYTPFAPADMATDPLIACFMSNVPPPLSVYRLRAYLPRTHTRLVVVRAAANEWNRIVRSATGVAPRHAAGSDVFAVNAARLRTLLVQPGIAGRQRRGVALVSTATPVASLVAVGSRRASVAAWLTYDWRSRHVIVEAASRTTAWTHADALSNRQVESSALSVAVGGRRSIVAWIEADGGKARLHVSESRRGRFHRIAIPQLGGVALQDAVAVAPNGIAVVAWTTQVGPRAMLHAIRVGANGLVTAVANVSDSHHSVDAFAVVAAKAQSIVAWRERDATNANLLMSTLQDQSPHWSAPVILSDGAVASAPIAINARFGPVVIWAHSGSFGASLNAERVGKGGRGLQPIELATTDERRIGTPSVAATGRGVLVAWCAGTPGGAALHVTLLTASRVDRYPPLRSGCRRSSPRLLTVGSRAILNSAEGTPQLYVLAHRLVCTTLAAERFEGAYRLLASPSGIEVVTASGIASGTVSVRSLAPLEHEPQPCRLSRRE